MWCLTEAYCDRMLGGLIGLHKETIKQPLAKAESAAASRIRNLVGRDLRYHQGVLDAFHINGSPSADDLAEAVIAVSELEGVQGKVMLWQSTKYIVLQRACFQRQEVRIHDH